MTFQTVFVIRHRRTTMASQKARVTELRGTDDKPTALDAVFAANTSETNAPQFYHPLRPVRPGLPNVT